MTAMLASLQCKEKNAPRKRNRLSGRISVLGEEGVSAQLDWRRGSHDDSRAAARVFADLCGKGYHAFAVCGKSARRIDSFSPALGEVILTPGRGQSWEDFDFAAWQASAVDARGLLRSALAYMKGRRPAARTGSVLQKDGKQRGERQALCMLLGMLDGAQRRRLRESASFTLRGAASGTTYLLKAKRRAEIDQLDQDGMVQYRLHIPAACMLPLHAALLAHALHLQDPECEHAYLSGATIMAGGT